MSLKMTILLVHIVASFQWCLKQTYYELAGSVINEVDWSPDNNLIVVGSNSKRVTVLSSITSNVVWFADFSNAVTTCKFGNLGKHLAVGFAGDDTVRIYNVPSFTPFATFRAQHGNTETIYELDFNSDDTMIATCASDGFVNQLFISGSVDWQSDIDSSKNVLACKYSTNDKVGLYCDDGKMYLLKSDGRNDEDESKNNIKDVDFRPGSERYLYGVNTDKKVYQFDTNSDNIGQYFNPNKDQIWAISYAPDSSFMALGMKNGHFVIVNTTSRSSPSQQQYFKPTSANILSLRVSHDSNYIVVSSDDGIIRIYARRCITCAYGFYRNQSDCRMCSLDLTGCASCLNSSICLTCFPNYYLDSSKRCRICDSSSTLKGCYLCKSSTVCYTCMQSFYLSGTTCSRCQLLTSQCEQCQNNGTCLKCSYRAYLTVSNTCSLCKNSINNCISCYLQQNSTSPTLSTLYCSQCAQGFYPSTTQCIPCPLGCLQCFNSSTCMTCAQQFRLSGVSCISCPQYCQACFDNATCLQCMPTTFLSSGACSLCSFPCLTCTSSATTCSSCPNGYFLSSTTCSKCVGCTLCNPFSGACILCPIGQYIQSPANTCSYCLNTTSHCQLCSASSCLSCERNYYLTGTGTCALSATLSNCLIYQKGSTTICQHCSLRFYLDSGTGNCIECAKQCISCDNPTNCTQCQVGYYMISTNATCTACLLPCISCNSSTQCLACGDEYYLSGTSCLKCWDQIPYCNSCLNSTHCVNCYLGYQLASNSLSCIQCVSPCATCNSSGCLSCEVGYFYLSNSCTRCPGQCSSCSSSTICTSCVRGYALDGSSSCVLCGSLFPNCTYCSNLACTTCKPYFMLDTSNICVSCNTNISNCLVCNNSGLCSMCSVGFYPASDNLSCIDCSLTMPKCQKCVIGTACDECQSGFFVNSTNQCQDCMDGCLTCNSQTACAICQVGFIKTASNTCLQCSQHIFGCQLCTSSGGCSNCLIGYYRSTSTSCLLCKSAMEGCISCSSNTICQSCDAGYFINGTNKCQKCSSSPGCAICNQSTAVCASCLNGYFLNSTLDCQLCSSAFTGCDICSSSACLRCSSGTYINSGSCTRCTTLSQGCILCNTSICLQCESGYYLDSNNSCQMCTLTGCQVCSPNGLTCLSCQNFYYKSGSSCLTCESMNFGCLSCNGINNCILCKTGYYLQTNGTCVLCESKFVACDVCTFSRCSVCETNYFYNGSSVAGDCLLCNNFLPGCSLCLNQASCLLCESGYYLNNLECHSCTTINQCMICQDNTTCLFCGAGYYLKNGQCLSCSTAIVGCFSCISETTCTTCSGSYVMSVGTCIEAKGITPTNYTNVRIVSQYLNGTHLKHTLMATQGISFRQIEQKWNQVTKIQLILPPNNKTTLTIEKVEWGQKNLSNSLIFYTNNPLGEISSSQSKSLPIIKFARRVLLTLQELNMQITFSMKQSAVNQLLPQLDTNGQDLGLDYKLDNPEFYKSIVKNQKYFFHIFGIAVVGLLVLMYLVKICFVIPMTSDAGEIIPHVLLLKLPAMVIYPALGGYINFCYGFTYLDFPFLNQFFSETFSNLSDKSPDSFLMFYNNLNIASTYLLALIIFLGLMIPLKILSIYKNCKKGNIQRLFDSKTSGFSQNQSIMEKPIDRPEKFMEFFYNIFIAGLTVSSFMGLLGMYYNPVSTISSSGAFYILCVFIYTLIWINAIKSFTDSKANFNRLRIVIKASLMTLIFWSPVPLFSAMVLIDVVLLIYEYKLKLKTWVVPKIWLVSHVLLIVSFTSLVFLNNMLIGIIVAFACVTAVLGLDILLIYYQHLEIQKIKDMREKSREYTENNLSIEGFIPERKDIMQNQINDLRLEQQNFAKKKDNNNLYQRSARLETKKSPTKSGLESTIVSNSMNLSKGSFESRTGSFIVKGLGK